MKSKLRGMSRKAEMERSRTSRKRAGQKDLSGPVTCSCSEQGGGVTLEEAPERQDATQKLEKKKTLHRLTRRNTRRQSHRKLRRRHCLYVKNRLRYHFD